MIVCYCEIRYQEMRFLCSTIAVNCGLWTEHFQFVGLEIVALTPIGRALVEAFELNSEKRVRIRRVEQLFGVFSST